MELVARKLTDLGESTLRSSSAHLLFEQLAAQERTGAASRMSVLMVLARVDSANDRYRGGSIVAWIFQPSLLAAYGGKEDCSFSRRGLNKDARHDAVVAISSATNLVVRCA